MKHFGLSRIINLYPIGLIYYNIDMDNVNVHFYESN